MLIQWFILSIYILTAARSENLASKKAAPCPPADTKESSLLISIASEIDFYGEISFGTPGQKFKALFDTGTGNILVPSAKCDITSCGAHNKYDSKKSTTYTPIGTPVTINYTIGEFSGIASTDTMKIGKFIIEYQTFAEITKAPSEFLSSIADSVVGLGHSMFQDNGEPALLNTMMSQGLIDEPVFSLYYNGSRKQLFFGLSHFKSFAGEMAYAPVVNKISPYWQIRMDGVLVGKQIFAKGSIANIDTGLAFVYGPMKEVAAINQALGGKCNVSGHFQVPCRWEHKTPILKFVLGGAAFEWNKFRLDFEVSPGKFVCLSALIGTDDEIWTVGTVFLSEIHTQFDMDKERVGFAKLLSKNGAKNKKTARSETILDGSQKFTKFLD